MKSEVRNPNPEARDKAHCAGLWIGIRLSVLGIHSAFGFRISGLAAVWLVAFVLTPAAFSQNVPHLGYVYPAGGRQGTTFQVAVGGQFLNGVSNAWLSGEGLQATIANYDRPLTGQQLNALREKLAELQQEPRSPTNQQQMAEIRQKIADTTRRNLNPVISEVVTLQVTLAPDVALGHHELRLRTPQGVSNPLVFCVDQLPEFSESELSSHASNAVMTVTLPATINGRIVPRRPNPAAARPGQPFTPGDVDRYRFEARKGQELVVTASARELIPYLADAVPGWFQATLGVYSARGKELAYDDDYRFNPDPVLHFVVPEDGDYEIEIKDALYRGREDFVYRISAGELPFVTDIFPLGGPAGARTTAQLRGWNLPADKVTMDASDKAPGVYPLTARKGALESNPKPFRVDALPECLEKEPNNSPKQAQRVTLPVIVNGHIDRPGDWDVFSFKAHAGEAIVAEVEARRLGSPLDSVLRLTDATGRQLAFNDDQDDLGSGLETHHADSYLTATLPADGIYYLYQGDIQHQGGPECAYRLRISAPQPDFTLRVVPSALNFLVGPTISVTVYALRRDGFSGDISLALNGAPAGFRLSGASVPAGQDKVLLTLTVPPTALKAPVPLSLEGRATIQGHEIVRPAIAADDLMQAFAYHHLVPANGLWASVTGRGAPQTALEILAERPLKVPVGGTAQFGVVFPALRQFESNQFELNDPVEGISVREVSTNLQGARVVLECDRAKAKPGTSGNFVFTISGERTPPRGNLPSPPIRRRITVGTLPAIPFEIIPPQ